MRIVILLTGAFFLMGNIFAQTLTSQQLLDKSIQYHDPKGKWNKAKLTLELKQDTPKRADRYTTAVVDNKRMNFSMTDKMEGKTIARIWKDGKCSFVFNGNKNPSQEDIEKNKLTCDRTKLMHGYYMYLYGLPMKLKDAGTIIHEEVKSTTFQGKECLSFKVTYKEDVGKDTWYFYFHPKTYALIGYRFYKDESKNDGEYITLEDEVVVKGMRIPRDRKWYFNIDDNFLGTDYLMSAKLK